MAYLSEALAYPIIEGSNIGIRRRQLQATRSAHLDTTRSAPLEWPERLVCRTESLPLRR